MITGQNTAVTGNLAGLVDKAGAKIAAAIQKASAKTGVDFSYLMQQAQIESSFKADAKACSSSATGLYQFIDKTWLSMVDKYGDKYGLSDVTDKKQILELRKDPELCSLMAAEMASDNKDYLEKCTGQDVGATELYMAHFMGPAGAGKFLKAMDNNPDAKAATLFPAAAAANKNVFYDKAGKAKTLEQVYAQFDKKFELQDGTNACSLSSAQPSVQSATVVEDIDTSTVLAAMTPRLPPAAMRSSSLYATPSNDYANADTINSALPKSLFSLISPVDVLELLKSQYTGHQTNA